MLLSKYYTFRSKSTEVLPASIPRPIGIYRRRTHLVTKKESCEGEKRKRKIREATIKHQPMANDRIDRVLG